MANAVEARMRNIQAVIEAIHRQPGIPKPLVCRQCGLSVSAVQGIVTHLQALGLVEAVGVADSTGGRKAQRYRLNPAYRYIVSASVRQDRAELGILNLGLELLRQRQVSLSLADTGPETYAGALAEGATALMAESGLPKELFCGMGVSVPGPTDFATGAVRELSGAAQWRDFPLGGRLSAALGLPVWVDKDAYMGAQYLSHTGEVDRDHTALLLTIGEGIGAGLILRGSIFRGSNGIAGEVGHVTVRRDGARCHCGNIGCLELYCSDGGVLSQYNVQSNEICDSVDGLIARAKQGDEMAQRVFVQAVRYLADATTGLILNYDPDEILIHCRWLGEQRQLFFSLLDGLYAKSVFTQRHTADIRLLGPEEFHLQAAASVVCTQYLLSPQSPHIRGLSE